MSDKIIIHATNINGRGAINLVNSLIPEIINQSKNKFIYIYVSRNNNLKIENFCKSNVKLIRYNRILPNKLSRLFECFFFKFSLKEKGLFIVLGDIPLRGIKNQILLLHQPNLFNTINSFSSSDLNFSIIRYVFKLNFKYVSHVIVQGEYMKNQLIKLIPTSKDKVSIIKQPLPIEYLNSNFHFNLQKEINLDKLILFYPALNYIHKNHKLLSEISNSSSKKLPVKELILTIDERDNPNEELNFIKCIGFCETSKCISYYLKSDALLFLSIKESYGFPLIEAMYFGLPIICPDLPYAIELCGSQAIYFDPNNSTSLISAIEKLSLKLKSGWRPNWKNQLNLIPPNWGEVAKAFLNLSI